MSALPRLAVVDDKHVEEGREDEREEGDAARSDQIQDASEGGHARRDEEHEEHGERSPGHTLETEL